MSYMHMPHEEHLKKVLDAYLAKEGYEVDGYPILPSSTRAFGNFTTTLPLIISAKYKKNSPLEIAEHILNHLRNLKEGELKSFQFFSDNEKHVAGAGYLNFFLDEKEVRRESGCVGKITTPFEGQSILVEHSSPNLFKPFHVGHLMNNIIGEFLVKAMEIAGGNVTTLSFPSDVSLGVAKAMFILLTEREKGFLYEPLGIEEQIIYFGDCYVKGVAYFKEHEDELGKAREIAHIIYDTHHTSDVRKLFLDIQKRSESYFRNVVSSLGSRIDDYIYESDVSERGTELVRQAIGKVFTESEGAVIYIPDEARKDIHTAVFINSEGHPTYEAKDIGLLDAKFSTYSPDISLTVTDVEQTQHFKIVFDAASKLGNDWQSKVDRSVHVPHGRMLFKGQKMSSRLGGVPLALDVIGVVEEEVRDRAGDKIANYSQEEKDHLTRAIALSALRIAILRSKPGININFDPEVSLSFEGDSGPYLLYTHARCASLLERGKEKGLIPTFSLNPIMELEWLLRRYNSTLLEVVRDLAPQKLVTYLFKVAQECNSFYANTQILTENKEESEHHLKVILWTKQVLASGLSVLGIEAVERM